MLTILESGMPFGPFPKEKVFPVEKSEIYDSVKKGFKTVEFLLLQKRGNDNVLLMVEAKSSSPNPNNPDSRMRHGEFIGEIKEKFVHSLLFFLGIKLERFKDFTEKDWPNVFQSVDLSDLRFCFVLVVRDHHINWLPSLQDCLRQEMDPIAKAFRIAATDCVTVYNEKKAREKRLICD